MFEEQRLLERTCGLGHSSAEIQPQCVRFGHRARAPPRRPCHPLSQFLGVSFPVMAVNYRTRTESVCFMPDGSEGSWGREHPQVGCSNSAHTSQLRRHLPVPHSLALSPCCPELCVLSPLLLAMCDRNSAEPRGRPDPEHRSPQCHSTTIFVSLALELVSPLVPVICWCRAAQASPSFH